jgi:rod shape-determining protein MreB and related proteins
MEEWLSKEIFVPVQLAPNPLESVAIGTGQALKYMHKLPAAVR